MHRPVLSSTQVDGSDGVHQRNLSEAEGQCEECTVQVKQAVTYLYL